MLDGLSTLAIVPKAKAIAARRLTKSEYEALARKRSVIEVTAALQAALPAFGRQLEGFDRPDAVLTGVESRSSSPVRLLRDAAGSSRLRGVYPCGEGAGYAGGIVSAAVDGIRCAEWILALPDGDAG